METTILIVLTQIYSNTLRILDINYSRVINLIERENASTAAARFSSFDKQFEKFQIPWEYCLAIGIGNTNTNIGDHNLTKSRALQKNSTLIMYCYVCHTLHNATCKAGSLFFNITSFDIEGHCVYLYHWLGKSRKRE